MSISMTLAFSHELKEATRYCATFARAKLKTFFDRHLIPDVNDPTATVTFVEFEGRTYAVTARHVIEEFRKMAIAEGSDPEGYFLPVTPGILINPPFISPPAPFMGHVPDVALRPIDQALPAHIGKTSFSLKADAVPTFPVPYALAAGFPTDEKADHSEPRSKRLAMPGVIAVAEGVGSLDADQVQFFSEIDNLP